MSYVMAPFAGVSLVFLPALSQLYIVVSSVAHFFQQRLVYEPRFRAWAGMPPLPRLGRSEPGAREASLKYQPPTQRAPTKSATHQDSAGVVTSSLDKLRDKVAGIRSQARSTLSNLVPNRREARRKAEEEVEKKNRILGHHKIRQAELNRARKERVARKGKQVVR